MKYEIIPNRESEIYGSVFERHDKEGTTVIKDEHSSFPSEVKHEKKFIMLFFIVQVLKMYKIFMQTTLKTFGVF